MHDPTASPASDPSTAFAARYFSADAPAGRAARVRLTPVGLVMALDAETHTWPYESLRQPRKPHRGEPAHLSREGGRDALVVSDGAILAAIRRTAPHAARHIRTPGGVPVVLALVVFFAGVAAALLAVTLVGIPALATSVARTLPAEWEEGFGRSMLESLAPPAERIDDPAVTAPIERVVSRLVARTSRRYRYDVVVVKRPDVNALAAPGGSIAVFAGLIEFARTPEELAGVIAHEVSHVERRHVTESILKQASLGLLVSLLAGDTHGSASAGAQMARSLTQLSYDRGAESEADADGLALLARARIDPTGLPDALARMGQQPGMPQWAEFLSTHPAPERRAEALRAKIAAMSMPVTLPVLNADEWKALKAAVHRQLPKMRGEAGR